MRTSGLPQPVVTFNLPPNPPTPVLEAKAKFDQVAGKWSEAKDELRRSKTSLVDTKAEDVRSQAAAFASGQEPTDVGKKEREAQAKVSDLETRVRALEVAVDEVGNELAQVISDHRNVWQKELLKSEKSSSTKLEKAIQEAEGALSVLRPSRSGIEWLGGFDVGLAQGGRIPGFSGGQLRVQVTRHGQPTDPVDLLRVVSQVVDPPRPKASSLGDEDSSRFHREASRVG